MEDNDKRLVLKGFVTDSGRNAPRAVRPSRSAAPEPKAGTSRQGQARVYLLIRLGVCVFLFCGVMALKLAGSSGAEALAVLSRSIGEETEPDTENLGRLRFVQIPSIAQVFSHSKTPAFPAEYSAVSILEEGSLMRLTVAENERVTSPCPGSVRLIGRDESLGGYVVVAAGQDTEYFVYGVGDIAVEVGQPIAQGSILGYAENGTVCVSVRQNGRPLDIGEIFGTVSAD